MMASGQSYDVTTQKKKIHHQFFNKIQGVVPHNNQNLQNVTNFYAGDLELPIKEGWLKKPAPMRGWQKRWFVLNSRKLVYYNSEDTSSRIHGSIDLRDDKWVSQQASSDTEKFVFEITTVDESSGSHRSGENMLLSTDSDDDRQAWIVAIKQVMFTEKGGAVFGQPLVDTMLYESMQCSKKIPTIVELCVNYLMDVGLQHEGIFRLSGRTSYIRELKDAFDRGKRPDFYKSETEVNTVASLFKQYLRDLPEPLIPVALYEDVMTVALRDIKLDPEVGRQRFVDLLLQLPRHNYNLLQYLCNFLHVITQHSHINKMTTNNLATVFHSMIIQPTNNIEPELLMATTGPRTQVVVLLIDEFDVLLCNEYTHRGEAVRVDNSLISTDVPTNPTCLRTKSNPGISAESDGISPRNAVSVMLDAKADDSVLFGNVDESTTKPVEIMNPAFLQQPLMPNVVEVANQNVNNNVSEKDFNGLDCVGGKQDSVDKFDPMEQDGNRESKGPPVAPKRNTKRFSASPEKNDKAPVPSAKPKLKEKMISLQDSEFDTVEQRKRELLNKVSSIKVHDHGSTLLRTRSEKMTRARPHPVPQPRAVSHRPRGIIEPTSDEEEEVDVSEDEVLLGQETETYTLSELREYTNSIKSRLQVQKEQCAALRESLAKSRAAHRNEVMSLNERVEQEKQATNDAITRMEALQIQLQDYQVKYGELLQD